MLVYIVKQCLESYNYVYSTNLLNRIIALLWSINVLYDHKHTIKQYIFKSLLAMSSLIINYEIICFVINLLVLCKNNTKLLPN